MLKLKFFNIYLFLLVVLVILPILAPVFGYIGLDFIAKPIYLIYSFFCHQFSSRSLHFGDYQYAWCARDTGIWIGFLLTAISISLNKVPRIKWFYVIPFLIPIALDGGIQTVATIFNISPQGVLYGEPLYISSNLSRFITGSIFGIGFSMWISHLVKSSGDFKVKVVDIKKVLKSFFIILFLSFLVYVFLVRLWDISSQNNKPSDFFDSAPKLPTGNFFSRRENAFCKTIGTDDLLNINCFLYGD